MLLFKRLASNPALRICLIYAVFAGCWILFSDQLLAMVPDQVNLTLLQTVKGLGFVGVTAALLYWLISSVIKPQSSLPVMLPRGRNTYKPLLLFTALSLGIGITGWFSYASMRDTMLQEKISDITAIGKLKAGQIEIWVGDNMSDGELLTRNSVMARSFADWVEGGARDPKLKAQFAHRLQGLAHSSRYTGLVLYDRSGKALLNPTLPDVEIAQHRPHALQAMAQDKTLLIDFHYRDAAHSKVEMGVVSPVVADGKVMGAVYFSIDPDQFLYPLIQSWPVTSPSAESLLVRRDDNTVTYLNQLRHHKHAPLAFSTTIKNVSVPAVQAVLGKVGVAEGLDYRGVEVLAYIAPIAGTDWKIVAKVDRSEALQAIRRLGAITTLVSLVLLGIAATMGWVWWRREIDRLQEVATMEKQMLAQHFDYLSRYANDAILLTDETGKFVEVNDRAREVYGYARDELLGKAMGDLRTQNSADYPADGSNHYDANGLLYEAIHQRKNGDTFPAEVSARLIEQGAHAVCHMVVRDITERKQNLARIQRLGELNATLSHVNEAIIHLEEEEEEEEQVLFRKVCQIAIKHGGLKMAWIGRLNPETQRIEPVASSGVGTDYLQDIVISINADLNEGRGPTGTAMRETRAQYTDNFLTNPATEPWHARALQFDWGSSAAVPVPRDGKPYAVLTLYQGELDAFDAESQTLVEEIANDLSFALDMLDVKKERKAALAKLQMAEMVVESSPAVLWRWIAADNWPTEYVSKNVAQFGYSAEDFLSGRLAFADIICPDDLERVIAEVAANSASGAVQYSQQYRIRCQDGSLRWLDDRTTVIRDAQGKITHYQGITTDTTQLMLAQQFVQDSERRLTLLLGNLPGMAFRCANDKDWSMQFVSQGCEALTGYPPEALLYNFKISFNDLIVLEDREMVWDQVQASIEKNSRYQINYRIHTAQGDIKYVWEQGIGVRDAQGNIEAIEGIAIDVTEQTLAEKQVTQNEQRFRAYFERSMVGMATTSLDKGWIDVNPALCEMLGYPHEQLIQKTWSELTYPDDLAPDLAQFNRVLTGETDEYSMDKRFIRSDGTIIQTFIAVRAVRKADGKIDYFVALVEDISDRKRASEALQASELRIRSMGDNLPDGFIYQYEMMANGQPRFNHISAGVERLLGVTPAQAMQDAGQIFAMVTPESMRDYLQAEEQSLKELSVYMGTLLFNTSNGQQRWMQIQSQPRRLADASVVWDGIAIDITGRVKDETTLALQAQRAQALLELPKAADTLDEKAFMQRGQELAEDLTGSQIAFIHLVNDDEESIELVAWSRRTLEHYCHAAFEKHYPVSQAGIWADALRQRQPVMFNDYATYPNKHGLPEGHSELNRLISVPVIENGKVVMLTGVGNKATDYTELDVETVQLISDAIWNIVQRQRSEGQATRFSQVLEQSLNEIYLFDGETLRFVDVNLGARTNLGYSMAELHEMTPVDIKPKITAEAFDQLIAPLRARQENQLQFTTEHQRKDGTVYPVEVHLELTDEQPALFVAIIQDITERQATDRKLQLDAEVFRQSREGIVVTDKDTRILSVNPAFTSISGYSEIEAIGQTTRLLKSERHDADFYSELWQNLLQDGMWQGEIWNRRKDGDVYPEWLHITSVKNAAGEITNYIGVFSDLTQSKQMQERITQLSRYDPVTGLPNLFFFDDLLSLAITEAEHHKHGIAIVRLDIENFHSIDDSYGFEVGDLALKTVADRLVNTVGKQGIITRMAKDNFTIAYPQTKDVTQATLLANGLREAISQPMALGEHEIHPGVNLGVSFYPSDGNTPRDLIQHAGIALNHAKADKTSNLRFFEQEMNDLMLSKIALTNEIRKAIEHEEFELYYQPQLDLANGKVVGMEALVRWNHPVHGFLPPCEFVQLAEESGLILPLGDWILKRAMLQMKEWMDAGITDLSIAVAVNASAMQMESGDLVDLLQKLLKEIDLPARCIELELTESLLMNNVADTQKLLQRLKTMGVRLSIDDFGTGYSSLSYLKQFAVDKLKIDKSFIDHVTTDPNDAVIVQATIAMARSMGLTVIAEGVETEAQASYLRTLQCDQMQGYYFSRPLPARDIMPLLRQNAAAVLKPVTEHQRTLLLVDDEPNVISSLKRILRREGYQILTANSGEEALEVMAKHPVHVIVSDQRMPNMTGIEFLSRVKVMHPHTIRIILSGYTEVNTITDAVNKGAVYKFLTKPWEDDELRETIQKAFVHFEQAPPGGRRINDPHKGTEE